jgi:hypothetical protein
MDRIGPYEIRGELGRGAMAVVWRAWDGALEREVALKEPLLPAGLADAARDEYMQRFQRECRTAARLNHPNTVTVFDAGVFDGRAVVVSELVEGETLEALLTRGSLPYAFAAAAMRELLSALEYAHRVGIVHRDVKPANIFITSEGRLKLADFGIASLAGSASLTRAGAALGSPGYMAPEQVRGFPTDARADIFAAGILLYEMLTGSNPFEAGNPISTMENTLHAALPPIQRPGIPNMVNEVIAVATAKDPSVRFGSADAMAAALAGAPIGATAATSAGVEGPRRANGPIIIVGAGVAALLGIGVLMVPGVLGPSPATVASGGAATAASSVQKTSGIPQPGVAAVQDPREGLTAELASVFAETWALESEFHIEPEIIFAASDGTHWASAVAQDSDHAPGYMAVMVRRGSSWERYALAEFISGYDVWYWGDGDPQKAIPAEAQKVLFAEYGQQ